MTNSSVRVLLAVSSPLTLKNLEGSLAVATGIEVVGIAKRMSEVAELIATTAPHLVCIDDAPPAIDALELTHEIMRSQARPLLVLSGMSDTKRRTSLLEAGALDVVARPVSGSFQKGEPQQFVARLKMLAHVPVIGRRAAGQSQTLEPVVARSVLSSGHATSPPSNRIVAIGASTGGPVALMTVLSVLPANFPQPIVCVQHVSRGFLEGMVTWLNDGCRLQVAIAQAGESVRAGTVLFPPEDRHLEVGIGGKIRLSDGPPRDGHRPSVTVLFESVAATYGSRATAILLTGMGSDGAHGLLAVHNAGGETIAQDEASCVVFGMPRVAIERGAARYVCSPEEIRRRLLAKVQ